MDKKSVFQNNPPEEWKEITIHWLKTSQYYSIPWIRKFVSQLKEANSDKEILALKKKLEKFLTMLEQGEELPQDDINELNRALLWGTIGIGGSGVATVEDAPEEPSGEPRPRELITQADFEALTGVRLREPTTQEIKDALRVPSDFGYSGDLPIGETWSIGPVIRTRDSSIREQSNADALEKSLKKIRQFEDEYQIVSANHWAVGWVDHLAFHAVDEDGEPTTIFRWLMGWNDNLENYPIADEEDYSIREYEEKIKQIEDEAYRIQTGKPIEGFRDWNLVLQWLEENSDEINRQTVRFLEDPENYDVDKDDVEKALKALDMFKSEPKFEISLVTMQNDPYKVNIYTYDIDEALEDGEILGEEWLEDSGEVVAILDNSQDLPERLEKEGYIVDKSEWFPPELIGQMSFSERVLPELLEDVPEYESPEDEVEAMVIVKGNKEEAIQEAWDRGFRVEMGRSIITHDANETQFYLRGSLNTLIRWFAEPPDRAPYPVGSLLHYREVEY